MNKTDIVVPNLPESVNTATIVTWHKKIGDYIKQDEIIVEIETDKIILEVASECNGFLKSIYEIEGNTVNAKQILGIITHINDTDHKKNNELTQDNLHQDKNKKNSDIKTINTNTCSPSVRRLISSHDINENTIKSKIINNRITRQDVESYINEKNNNLDNKNQEHIIENKKNYYERGIKRIKINNFRKCIADRLLHVVNNTAMLTTFNEVNMHSIIKLRKKYGDDFKKKHGVRLGFMSFYVKSVIEALKKFPIINAAIDNEDIIYYDFFDINIAVSSERGLVTPVLKNANLMKMYEIEKKIQEFAKKAQDAKLDLKDLQGGTFTITNGGVFGSLLSTPIINPPQSAILGIHHIKERPVAVNNQVCIYPMMYIALSYDHRIIDGREAIGFLLMIKEILEDFNRIILNI